MSMSARWLPPSPEAARRALAAEIRQVLQHRRDPRPWIEENLWIRDKGRRVIPLIFNAVQRDYHPYVTDRDMILKARQQGFTTYCCARFFADTILHHNTTSVMVAHDLDSAERTFRIVQLFWERLPEEERKQAGKPRFSNRREFLWPKINSHFYVGTAGALTLGRGQTINNLHCSEFAFWLKPQESLAALMQAVPAGGNIVIESTPNGIGNYFHDLWRQAKAGEVKYRWHFYMWWDDPSYALPGPPLAELTEREIYLQARYGLSDDQVRWRRAKERDLRELFKQEYPEDDLSCFLASTRACFDLARLQQIATRISGEPAPEVLSALPHPAGITGLTPARLLVWRRPQEGRLYVIGADVGEGLAQGDASCAVVLDRERGEQVAELYGRVPPDRFAHMLDALGRWYNRAQLAVERNNHGHSTLNTLRNVCHYPWLYYHVRYDARYGQQPTLGWPTDQATKPILVDDLAAAIAEGSLILHSGALVDECMTFVTTNSGSQEAEQGKLDDRVMAAGIAWQVRKRPVTVGTTQRPAGW